MRTPHTTTLSRPPRAEGARRLVAARVFAHETSARAWLDCFTEDFKGRGTPHAKS